MCVCAGLMRRRTCILSPQAAEPTSQPSSAASEPAPAAEPAPASVARMRELLGQLELLEAKPTSRYAQEAAAAAAGESPGGASDASAARGCEDGSLASQGGVGVSRKMDTAV